MLKVLIDKVDSAQIKKVEKSESQKFLTKNRQQIEDSNEYGGYESNYINNHQLKDRDLQSESKNKTQVYSVYKKSTLNIKTHIRIKRW